MGLVYDGGIYLNLAETWNLLQLGIFHHMFTLQVELQIIAYI